MDVTVDGSVRREYVAGAKIIRWEAAPGIIENQKMRKGAKKSKNRGTEKKSKR